MDYGILKSLHASLAVISISGFALRWGWMRAGSALLQHRLTRTLPHVVDTLFLASGIWLTIILHQYPFMHGWLTAKVLGLVAYVILGSLALKHARTPWVQVLSFSAALLVFAWLASVARSKSAAGFLAALF